MKRKKKKKRFSSFYRECGGAGRGCLAPLCALFRFLSFGFFYQSPQFLPPPLSLRPSISALPGIPLSLSALSSFSSRLPSARAEKGQAGERKVRRRGEQPGAHGGQAAQKKKTGKQRGAGGTAAARCRKKTAASYAGRAAQRAGAAHARVAAIGRQAQCADARGGKVNKVNKVNGELH